MFIKLGTTGVDQIKKEKLIYLRHSEAH